MAAHSNFNNGVEQILNDVVNNLVVGNVPQYKELMALVGTMCGGGHGDGDEDAKEKKEKYDELVVAYISKKLTQPSINASINIVVILNFFYGKDDEINEALQNLLQYLPVIHVFSWFHVLTVISRIYNLVYKSSVKAFVSYFANFGEKDVFTKKKMLLFLKLNEVSVQNGNILLNSWKGLKPVNPDSGIDEDENIQNSPLNVLEDIFSSLTEVSGSDYAGLEYEVSSENKCCDEVGVLNEVLALILQFDLFHYAYLNNHDSTQIYARERINDFKFGHKFQELRTICEGRPEVPMTFLPSIFQMENKYRLFLCKFNRVKHHKHNQAYSSNVNSIIFDTYETFQFRQAVAHIISANWPEKILECELATCYGSLKDNSHSTNVPMMLVSNYYPKLALKIVNGEVLQNIFVQVNHENDLDSDGNNMVYLLLVNMYAVHSQGVEYDKAVSDLLKMFQRVAMHRNHNNRTILEEMVARVCLSKVETVARQQCVKIMLGFESFTNASLIINQITNETRFVEDIYGNSIIMLSLRGGSVNNDMTNMLMEVDPLFHALEKDFRASLGEITAGNYLLSDDKVLRDLARIVFYISYGIEAKNATITTSIWDASKHLDLSYYGWSIFNSLRLRYDSEDEFDRMVRLIRSESSEKDIFLTRIESNNPLPFFDNRGTHPEIASINSLSRLFSELTLDTDDLHAVLQLALISKNYDFMVGFFETSLLSLETLVGETRTYNWGRLINCVQFLFSNFDAVKKRMIEFGNTAVRSEFLNDYRREIRNAEYYSAQLHDYMSQESHMPGRADDTNNYVCVWENSHMLSQYVSADYATVLVRLFYKVLSVNCTEAIEDGMWRKLTQVVNSHTRTFPYPDFSPPQNFNFILEDGTTISSNMDENNNFFSSIKENTFRSIVNDTRKNPMVDIPYALIPDVNDALRNTMCVARQASIILVEEGRSMTSTLINVSRSMGRGDKRHTLQMPPAYALEQNLGPIIDSFVYSTSLLTLYESTSPVSGMVNFTVVRTFKYTKTPLKNDIHYRFSKTKYMVDGKDTVEKKTMFVIGDILYLVVASIYTHLTTKCCEILTYTKDLSLPSTNYEMHATFHHVEQTREMVEHSKVVSCVRDSVGYVFLHTSYEEKGKDKSVQDLHFDFKCFSIRPPDYNNEGQPCYVSEVSAGKDLIVIPQVSRKSVSLLSVAVCNQNICLLISYKEAAISYRNGGNNELKKVEMVEKERCSVIHFDMNIDITNHGRNCLTFGHTSELPYPNCRSITSYENNMLITSYPYRYNESKQVLCRFLCYNYHTREWMKTAVSQFDYLDYTTVGMEPFKRVNHVF
jgi:hypothetical protein